VVSVIVKDTMAQKDRISIDISDVRDEIDTCRDDAAWQELPLSSKIRVLIKERLELLGQTKTELTQPKSGAIDL
jgi:hypothetical protein